MCAALPAGREQAYFMLQSLFGDIMGKPDPFSMLEAGAEIVADFRAAGGAIEGARCMEVGTGRRLDLPLALWLSGAAEVATFDLNRRLRPELVMRAVGMLLADRERVVRALGAEIAGERLARLEAVRNFAELLELTRIRYVAPGDAARTDLASRSIDLHFSYTVFEHIPLGIIRDILAEGARLLSPVGAAIHHVDISDHFAHDDANILPINFLRYSQPEWDRWADNQFAYHNRARASEYRPVYEEAGHEIIGWRVWGDEKCVEAVRGGGFRLDSRYQQASDDDLRTLVVRITSRPK